MSASSFNDDVPVDAQKDAAIDAAGGGLRKRRASSTSKGIVRFESNSTDQNDEEYQVSKPVKTFGRTPDGTGTFNLV
jgi:hypothetical protein